jgi:hypothetical protein
MKNMNNESMKPMKSGIAVSRVGGGAPSRVESLGRCGKRPCRVRPDFGGDYRAEPFT